MKFERFGLGIAKGLALTVRHLFRKPITVQYPEEKLSPSRRIRGNEFIWDARRCTGCATCAKSCPHGVIDVVTSVGPDNNYIVEKVEIDYGLCMFCGLCVEACPFEAVFLGRGYEGASYSRNQLVADKGELMAPGKEPSAYARSWLEPQIPKQTLLLYRKQRGF